MDTQRIIGADIIMAFDECTPYPCDYKYARESMEMTHRWLTRCFNRFNETIYSQDGLSATYHAEHDDWAVSLAIDCCTLRKTASLAVSGIHNDEAYALFSEASAQLFGDC